MSFFKYFPLIEYDSKQVIDVFRRADIVLKIKNSTTSLETYLVQDGETPETISYKLYGTVRYHWMLLMVNDIENPFYDWVLSVNELDDYITSIYGSGNEEDVKHYVTNSSASIGSGFIVDSTYTTLHRDSVSNRAYETTQNEIKREIRVIRPEYLQRLETEFAKQIKE